MTATTEATEYVGVSARERPWCSTSAIVHFNETSWNLFHGKSRVLWFHINVSQMGSMEWGSAVQNGSVS